MLHLKFVKKLVDQLVGEFREDRSRASILNIQTRLNKRLHILRKGKKETVWFVPTGKNQDRDEKQQNSDTCPGKPRLHIGDCFEKYHTLRNFKS